MPEPFQIAPETFAIPSHMPIPGHGILNVNAFVIRAQEPVIIDTSAPIYRDEFLQNVFSVVDPADVRWVFITHEDRDHSGSLMQVLEACPQAKLCHNFLGLGKLGEEFAIPPDRVRLVDDGDSLDVGDRTLAAIRPPLYDAPTTRGVWDPTTNVYFSSDCFGANLDVPVQNVDEAPADGFEEGFYWMNRVNHTWHAVADPRRFGEQVDRVRRLGAEVIASGHGPMATGRTDQLLNMVSRIPAMNSVKLPTNEEFEAMVGAAGSAPAATT